jgi:Uma2 family endonuclease
MIVTTTKPISLTEFLDFPETEPASEFIDGRISQKPMPQGKHSTIQKKLVFAIDLALSDQGIAQAFPELRCTFGDRSLVPDVSVFRTERIPRDQDDEIANVFTSSPDWVIEILSPDQSSTKVTKNILHCLQHGTEIGWLIDPAEQSIFVYRVGQQVEAIDIPDQTIPVPEFATPIKLTLGEVFNWLKLA